MKEATIRDARNQLTRLVHQAERGQAIRLTRRGKPVAVLVSDREYQRFRRGRERRPDFFQFLQGWRREMIAKGIPFMTDEEITAFRDRTPGPATASDE
jgi:prevent-host-death family protein